MRISQADDVFLRPLMKKVIKWCSMSTTTIYNGAPDPRMDRVSGAPKRNVSCR